ncbi:hypothetical protein [Paenibacillus sp. 481]|uniref:hypothetical protein n=1 Tax=Paenibacillus sp. 481 TaxID=2835869 RepID=UPI001E3C46DE|nr:hypothetical protein [Paenibacillus sp. 481]UHA74772.1 hypothetical protein KIK04_06835 [Paenibacillus sp. 481]
MALKYLAAQEMEKETQDKLRRTLIAIGAKSAATKAATALAELLPNTSAFNIPHLTQGQTC